MADRGPIRFSLKPLWQDLILLGILGENMDKQSNLVLPSLWKVLPKGKQVTPWKEGSEKPSVTLSALPLTEEFQGWIPHTSRDWGLGQHEPLEHALGGDQRPHVELTIYWSCTNKHTALALIFTG